MNKLGAKLSSLLLSIIVVSLGCSHELNKTEITNFDNSQINAINSPTPKVVNSPCDDDDEYAPAALYSSREIKKNFKEADVVVYAEVTQMTPKNLERGYRPYIFKAKIKEVFKGNFISGNIIDFGDTFEVYDEEPDQNQFLGERVLWLKEYSQNSEIKYGEIEFMAGGIECNILEKLRKISHR